MSKYDNILNIVEQSAIPLDMERIKLTEALNRVLREDIFADMDMPPFDKAAMDGFACRRADLENVLEIVDYIPAGQLPNRRIGVNQCARIMTGAIVPNGADMVFMLEDSQLIDSSHVRCVNLNSKKNICYRGEDFRRGDRLLSKGIFLRPWHVGIMASIGCTEVWVSKLPRIAVMATGSELVEPNMLPSGAQIRNSNSYTLMSLIQQIGLSATYLGIVTDEMNDIRKKTEEAIAQNQLLIITGGASKGDYDFTTDVLKYFGFDILVETTGLQPGNPMIFARKEEKYCFGLSGNPVSSFVQFELFVRPFLFRMLDGNIVPQWTEAKLAKDFCRKKAGRLGIIPVKLHGDYSAEPLDFHGSAHLNALASADALMQIPESVTDLKKGEKVYVRPIQ